MELNFYTLCVIYLVYSFLGWVAETVVATIKGRAFVNRGVASGPFCFVYGTAAVLMAVGFADLRSTPVALFLGCAANATVVEWVTAKLLERMHRRRWWDYSDKKFNLDGYVCLQYSVLWGLLGMASVLWGNVLLLRLCAILPGWLLHIGVWAAMTLAVLDQLGAALAVNRYAASHPRLEQLNLELEKHSDKLRQRLIAHVEKRIQRAYPAIVQPEPTVQKEKALSFGDLVWLFVIGAFLGDVVETLFCRARYYQSVILLPYLMSWVVVSYLVYTLLAADTGLINSVLKTLGLKSINWYQEQKYWPFILTFCNIWKGTGYSMIIYLSSIVGISQDYYEAARIDGATKWKQITDITLPLLKPTVMAGSAFCRCWTRSGPSSGLSRRSRSASASSSLRVFLNPFIISCRACRS